MPAGRRSATGPACSPATLPNCGCAISRASRRHRLDGVEIGLQAGAGGFRVVRDYSFSFLPPRRSWCEPVVTAAVGIAIAGDLLDMADNRHRCGVGPTFLECQRTTAPTAQACSQSMAAYELAALESRRDCARRSQWAGVGGLLQPRSRSRSSLVATRATGMLDLQTPSPGVLVSSCRP
jgi:hypothetical protein